MISFYNVIKRFGPHTVLDQINFTIQAGEFVLLKGPSGSGKSTIVSLLIGDEKPDSGAIEVDHLLVTDMDDDTLQLYRRKLGVVFQDYKLLPNKTVFENVAFAMEACEESDEIIQRRVPAILEKVGLLHFQDQYPDHLSGGERQRLAIARALVHNPSLLIADEPTGNLDEVNVKSIIHLFEKLHSEGMTILLTTHDPLVQELVNGRVLSLEYGKVR